MYREAFISPYRLHEGYGQQNRPDTTGGKEKRVFHRASSRLQLRTHTSDCESHKRTSAAQLEQLVMNAAAACLLSRPAIPPTRWHIHS